MLAHDMLIYEEKSKLSACHETIKPRGKFPDAVPPSSLFVCMCVCVISCVRLLIRAGDRISQQAFPAHKPIS